MHPEISIFGRAVPTYWLCAIAGLIACSAVARVRYRRFDSLSSVDVTNAAGLMVAGVIAGGRLLSIATLIPAAWGMRERIAADPSLLYRLFSNGLVFYGGLFGALAALVLYIRRYRLDAAAMLDFFAPMIPLFHAFGRVGCFMNGCCHGQISEQLGIAFSASPSAPNGVPLFPIQLVCAGLNLALFAIVLVYGRVHRGEGKSIYLYLGLYACGRLVVEFFRGDAIRGALLCLSTSQWISLLVLAFLMWRAFRARGFGAIVA